MTTPAVVPWDIVRAFIEQLGFEPGRVRYISIDPTTVRVDADHVIDGRLWEASTSLPIVQKIGDQA